jgi:ATP-dependent exoDNAse (exonuclease V) alpha subunit
MLRQTEAVRLVEPVGAGVDEPRWTSADLLATEQTALALAMTTTNVPAHTDGDAAARAATTTGLSSEQQHLVASLLVSPRLVDVVVGPAGSGKTALVRAAAAGWDDVGAPVVGCSLAAVAARRLGAATGIATCSVTRLLADADRVDPDTGHPTGLAPRTVVVVDEASMVGTRNLTALASHVDSCGGKLVLVGDAAQLPEIDAGGLFAALARRATPLTLTSNQRQHEQWERTALLALRDGDTDTAIDAYFAHGRIHVCDDAHAARQQLVNAYVAQRAAGTTPFDLVALASTRRDVTSLNASIRAGLQRAGAVAAGGTTMLTSDGPLELAAGDLVLVTRNDHSRGLLNGTRATVTRTTGLGVELALESGEHTTVATGWAAEHLDHGYALTVHKAQGLTTAVALVFGTQALDQQAGYVALSRGQVRNHLFTSIDSLNRTEPDLDVARFRILDREPPDVADALAQRLARSRRQVLASHQRPHVDDVWDRLRHDVHHRSRDGYGIDR